MAKNNTEKSRREIRPFAIVTGASTSIGYELAKCWVMFPIC
jgi:short-subunit dehydrogenase